MTPELVREMVQEAMSTAKQGGNYESILVIMVLVVLLFGLITFVIKVLRDGKEREVSNSVALDAARETNIELLRASTKAIESIDGHVKESVAAFQAMHQLLEKLQQNNIALRMLLDIFAQRPCMATSGAIQALKNPAEEYTPAGSPIYKG